MNFLLLLLALFGFAMGFGIILGDNVDLMQFCSKGCGITLALVEIFGSKVASFIVGASWIIGGVFFLWIVFKNNRSE